MLVAITLLSILAICFSVRVVFIFLQSSCKGVGRDSRSNWSSDKLGTRVEAWQQELNPPLSKDIRCQDIPANVVEFGADFVQQFVLFGGFSKLAKAFEVGFKDGAVIDGSKCNFSFDAGTPLINTTFHLGKHEQCYRKVIIIRMVAPQWERVQEQHPGAVWSIRDRLLLRPVYWRTT